MKKRECTLQLVVYILFFVIIPAKGMFLLKNKAIITKGPTIFY
ncbi:hypothetical protein [Pectinatus sottacetonis]|nr:hypothetical protein [Pectinatus sottacetonis]